MVPGVLAGLPARSGGRPTLTDTHTVVGVPPLCSPGLLGFCTLCGRATATVPPAVATTGPEMQSLVGLAAAIMVASSWRINDEFY